MDFLLGIDEAGRGPLAGPVALGAVVTERGYDIPTVFPGVNDSKKLSPKKREALYELIEEEAKKGNIRATVCFGSEGMIDRRGIAPTINATLIRALRKLAPVPEQVEVFLDGSLHAPKEYRQQTIVGGDALVPHIMLASIVAKVSRDRLMVELSLEHPGYGFEVHKGYGTKAHYAALQTLGLSPIHRKSFIHMETGRE